MQTGRPTRENHLTALVFKTLAVQSVFCLYACSGKNNLGITDGTTFYGFDAFPVTQCLFVEALAETQSRDPSDGKSPIGLSLSSSVTAGS